MDQLHSLKEILQGREGISIDNVAKYIEQYIGRNWKDVLCNNREKLIEAYHKGGDLAYGTYTNYLFSSIHQELAMAKLKPEPRLPGDLNISREWGEENNRQRWIWSTIKHSREKYLGTIVTILYHDHTEFRIPKAPKVFALEESEKESIVTALSRFSQDFKQAKEHKIVMEEYFSRGTE